MCGIAQKVNPANALLGHRLYRNIDPTMGNLEDLDRKLFEAPKIPGPPPPPQEAKMPDTPIRKPKYRAGQSTLLTGSASGLTAGSLNTGGTTLLGG